MVPLAVTTVWLVLIRIVMVSLLVLLVKWVSIVRLLVPLAVRTVASVRSTTLPTKLYVKTAYLVTSKARLV